MTRHPIPLACQAILVAAAACCVDCRPPREGSLAPVVEHVTAVSGDVTFHVEAVSSAKQFYVAPLPQTLDEAFLKGEADYHLVVADKAAIVGVLSAAPTLHRRPWDGIDYRGEFRG